MARRAGKAARRKARQRNVASAPRPALAPSMPTPEAGVDDMVETVSASSPSTRAATAAPARPSRRLAPPGGTSAGGSSLTATEVSEYHYVERDLRNIGILTLVMFALLIGAWLVFSATGLIH